MVNKTIIQVPQGVRYLSDWESFMFRNFPNKAIIDKQLPGCGFTEFALTCPENVVLCSPRKILLENKKDQHPDTVYLVINDYEIEDSIDEDVSKPHKITKEDIEDETQKLKLSREDKGNEIFNRLLKEIGEYIIRMDSNSLPYKVCVTYDSTHFVIKVLQKLELLLSRPGFLFSFRFIVDEFQSILDDSRFKANTELEFMSVTNKLNNLLFVSATPMLDDSISKLDDFKDLPYFEFDWKTLDPSRIKKPGLKIRTMKSVTEKATEIIQTYLEGKFEKAIVERGGELVEVYSTEAVFFVNCVGSIVSIIKKMGLKADQVNILCARTRKNRRKIQRKLGKFFNIGRVPTRGESHKMFTFCTRTVYLGADFYSLCARSFIFSDSNANCLSVDISLDLPQILGRQRLDENPWKNSAEFYYRVTCDWKSMSKEDFDELVAKKIARTKNLLEAYESCPEHAKHDSADNLLYISKTKNYRDDYIGVDRFNQNTLVPQFNKLVFVNEERAFQIQQVDYANRFSVFCKLRNKVSDVSEINIAEFFYEYDQLTTYVDKMKYLCEFSISNSSDIVSGIIGNLADSDKIKQHFIALGPDKIKALCYNVTLINRAIGKKTFDKGLLNEKILILFSIGKRYTKKELKFLLGKIYEECGYTGKPKANDLENWFEIKECKITVDGKREMGFEIISIK